MIGYYVHHQGRGHLHRALCLTAQLNEPVVILTSAPRPATCTDPALAGWVNLPRDDEHRPRGDPTAHGVLHWAPPHDPGLRGRMAGIAAWIAANTPSVMIVDVSVEVTALCRLMGVPIVVVAMPGERTDPAHRLGYDLADLLLACWPADVMTPDWPPAWTAKTRFVGAFSRFDSRIGEPHPAPSPSEQRRVAVLLGAGGADITEPDIAAAAAATPHWDWDILGGTQQQWRADPWPTLRSAHVVVTHAGQNALAEVAAARVPAIVVPQRRPHNEQYAAAGALERAGLAVILRMWPAPGEWADLLEKASTHDGRRWAQWCPGDGARRAARHIEAVAAQHRTDGPSCASP